MSAHGGHISGSCFQNAGDGGLFEPNGRQLDLVAISVVQLLEGNRVTQLGHLINDWRLANVVSPDETLGCFAKETSLIHIGPKCEVVDQQNATTKARSI